MSPDLRDCLTAALPDLPHQVHVAVSGGIDSWLLAALLRSLGHEVQGWYLETRVPQYCEADQVRRFSETLSVPTRYLGATAGDFLAALPDFLAITETPIYNLHPVSKLLLARALRDQGIGTVVSGDGADQSFRCEWNCDLLPLTEACFHSTGVRLITPFVSDPVRAFCRVPDPDKGAVRQLAHELGVPPVPKHPTYFPEVPLPPQPRAAILVPESDPYRRECLSYTTGLLLCAASQA